MTQSTLSRNPNCDTFLKLFLNVFALSNNTARWPVFVVHKSFFEDESIVFRHGMTGIFSIENKIMVVDGDIIKVEKEDFPLSTLDQSLSEDLVDPAVFGRPFSFVD